MRSKTSRLSGVESGQRRQCEWQWPQSAMWSKVRWPPMYTSYSVLEQTSPSEYTVYRIYPPPFNPNSLILDLPLLYVYLSSVSVSVLVPVRVVQADYVEWHFPLWEAAQPLTTHHGCKTFQHYADFHERSKGNNADREQSPPLSQSRPLRLYGISLYFLCPK